MLTITLPTKEEASERPLDIMTCAYDPAPAAARGVSRRVWRNRKKMSGSCVKSPTGTCHPMVLSQA